MNETQAKEIITLLKSIDSRLSSIETNTSNNRGMGDDIEKIIDELKNVNNNLEKLQP